MSQPKTKRKTSVEFRFSPNPTFVSLGWNFHRTSSFRHFNRTYIYLLWWVVVIDRFDASPWQDIAQTIYTYLKENDDKREQHP